MVRGHGLVLACLVLGFSLSSGEVRSSETYTLTFTDTVRWTSENSWLRLDDVSQCAASDIGRPSLPWRVALIPQIWPTTPPPTLVVVTADTLNLPGLIIPAQPDHITSDTATAPAPALPDADVYDCDSWYPSTNVRFPGGGRFEDLAVTPILWCPLRYNPVRGELIVIRRAVLCTAGDPAPQLSLATMCARVPSRDLLADYAIGHMNSFRPPPPSKAESESAPDWVWPADPPPGVEYVVVTGAAYVPALRPLVEWKARRGIAAGVATVEAITAQYPGVDAAAAIREYLKAAHAAGLEWVVLAGDENVVPIRYAYAELEPYTGDPHKNQICDLYFAELDGDWDVDGDGVWGEYFDDHAEIYPELYVGRIPFSDATEAVAFVDKLIAYERGPADGAYLQRSLSVCADQMRDWSDGEGQHAMVAEVMPSGWTNDVSSMIEEPTGIDPSPVGPFGESFPRLLAQGYGWVNYFVHGRADAFAVRSAGFLETPVTYVYTYGNDGDGHGHLNLTPSSATPGVHLSAACDQGAFDLDAPAMGGSGESVAERLLLLPAGGAIAFIGQSRWGWISTSYKVVRKFYEYTADDNIPNHIGIPQTLAKLAFPGYHDLVYGNNLYGDPEMPTWRRAPLPLEVAAPVAFTPGLSTWGIAVSSNGTPVSDALVTLAIADSVWVLGRTDLAGQVLVDRMLPSAPQVILTVHRSGYRTWTDTLPVSIIADVGSDPAAIAGTFALNPGVPNPFNPATQLRFSLDRDGPVTVAIYDLLGRRVRTLVAAYLSAGPHECTFTGTDADGRPLASGVYFALLESDRRVRTQKLVLLR